MDTLLQVDVVAWRLMNAQHAGNPLLLHPAHRHLLGQQTLADAEAAAAIERAAVERAASARGQRRLTDFWQPRLMAACQPHGHSGGGGGGSGCIGGGGGGGGRSGVGGGGGGGGGGGTDGMMRLD